MSDLSRLDCDRIVLTFNVSGLFLKRVPLPNVRLDVKAYLLVTPCHIHPFDKYTYAVYIIFRIIYMLFVSHLLACLASGVRWNIRL